ncbi:hypothetical protein B0H16DRAFT_466708 [Mycena metata]|uniref:Uncharacterized protein n=1 Tax=Mycena metata TaxID=1033252 RepID=A0AAD7KC55_9AGAR|nr:hypothetical protein B0H16DRAFT_466708 [Mycena metata]
MPKLPATAQYLRAPLTDSFFYHVLSLNLFALFSSFADAVLLRRLPTRSSFPQWTSPYDVSRPSIVSSRDVLHDGLRTSMPKMPATAQYLRAPLTDPFPFLFRCPSIITDDAFLPRTDAAAIISGHAEERHVVLIFIARTDRQCILLVVSYIYINIDPMPRRVKCMTRILLANPRAESSSACEYASKPALPESSQDFE